MSAAFRRPHPSQGDRSGGTWGNWGAYGPRGSMWAMQAIGKDAGVSDEFYGVPTPAMAEKTPALDKMRDEVFTQIILGAPVDATFDKFVQDWKKLGGILVETSGEMQGPTVAVVGVGINYRLGEAVAGRIEQPATDVASCAPALPSRNALLGHLLRDLVEALERFAQEGFVAFRDEWQGRHAYAGCRVTVLESGGRPREADVVEFAEDGGDCAHAVSHSGAPASLLILCLPKLTLQYVIRRAVLHRFRDFVQ